MTTTHPEIPLLVGRPPLRIRAAGPSDEPFLWQMLILAAHADAEGHTSPATVMSDPALARYVRGWGRHGDLGVVCTRHSRSIGAAWLRTPTPADRSSAGYIDEVTPEIAIAVEPNERGAGVGTRMLIALLDSASSEFDRVTLNVRADNPAIRLYQRLGFGILDTIENRVGSTSVRMVRRLCSGGRAT